MRILISNPDTIGDTVLRQPMLAALAAAGHDLMLICRPSVAPLARQIVPAAAVVILPYEVYAPDVGQRWEAFAATFDAAAKFAPDLLVVAPFVWTAFEEELARRLAAVPRVGMSGQLFAGDPYGGTAPAATLTFDRLVRVHRDEDEAEKNARLAAAVLDAPGLRLPDPALEPPAAAVEGARGKLASLGLAEGKYWAACVAGTEHVRIKTWPAEKWGLALRHWVERYGRKFLFVGLPVERAAAERARAAMGDAATHTAFAMDEGQGLDDLQALLALSRGYVGHDTGPMHVAAAVGRPVLAVFGGGTWPRFLPGIAPSVALTVGVPCAGCGWNCPYEAPYCLRNVPVEDVVRAIDDLEAGRVATRESRVIAPTPALTGRIVREAVVVADRRLREAGDLRTEVARLRQASSVATGGVAPTVGEAGGGRANGQPPRDPAAGGDDATAVFALLKEVEGRVRSLEQRAKHGATGRPPNAGDVTPAPEDRRPVRQALVDAFIGRQHIPPRHPAPLPPISVIIPMLDPGPDRIRRTIGALLGQNYPDLDVIVVDRGSSDGSLEAVEAYGDKVGVINARGETAAGAAHAALERGQGEVLTFARPGDTYEPGALLRAGALFRARRRVNVAYFETTVVATDGRRTNAGPARWVDTLDVLASATDPQPLIDLASLFVRRRAYIAAGGVDRTLSHAWGWDLTVRLARMFGLRRAGASAAVRMASDPPPADHDPAAALAERTAARDQFLRRFGRPGRARCAALHAVHKLSNETEVARRRWRLNGAAAGVPGGPGAPAADVRPLPDDAPPARCPLTGAPADRLLFTAAGGDGVARPVYYSATAHAAVVRQPTDGPLAPAPASQADGESLAADVLRVLSGVIKPFDASRRLISLGCGDGAVLDVLHARTGWRVHGVDPDADRAAAARGKGYAVYESAVEDAATAVPAVEPFDVVLVEPHALAASADPLRLLRRARHLLTTGGVIVLAGANLDAGGFAEQGRAWPAWDVAGTRYVLSPKAVRLLARDAQLEPVRVRTLTNGAVDRTGRGERFVAVLKYGGG